MKKFGATGHKKTTTLIYGSALKMPGTATATASVSVNSP